MMGFGIGRMGLAFRGPRPVPSWVAPGAAFHIKPASGWAWINGREYTSFAALVADPTAASYARASECYALTSAGTFTRFDSGVPAITDLGLLVEGEETAVASLSIDVTDWGLGASNATTVGYQPGPINNRAILLTANGAAAQHYKSTNGANLVSGTTYLMWVIVEQLSNGCIQLAASSAGFGTTAFANFDLSGSGTVGTKGATCLTSGMIKLSNGRFLIWMTAQATTTGFNVPVNVAFIPLNTSSRLNSHASSASVVISARQVSTTMRWGSPIDVGDSIGGTVSPEVTRAPVVLVIKPAAATHNVTYKFGDGTADQTASGAIGAGGYTIPTNLNGRFISDIIGFTV